MVRAHLRGNIVGYVALFIALTAGAYAAGLPRNSVKSKQIRDGQVRLTDLAGDSVDGTKVVNGSLSNADFGGRCRPVPPAPKGQPAQPDRKGRRASRAHRVFRDPPGHPTPGRRSSASSRRSTGPAPASTPTCSTASAPVPSSPVAVRRAVTWPAAHTANPQIAAGAVGPPELGVIPAARAVAPNDAACTGTNPSGAD